MLTLDDIKKYKEIGTKIDNLAKEYYEKFICCDDTYEYLGWELNDEIIITYSYLDYSGERCYDYIPLTFDKLYGKEVNNDILYNMC